MKKIILSISVLLLSIGAFAQAPQKMSYQAVVRNNAGALISNQQISMRISILQGSATGTAVYVEKQTPMTNANGLASTEIGAGTVVSGVFTSINWANGPYFVKTETDPAGGTNYSIIGTSQLLSVPYALHAKTAESITGGIAETDPVFNGSVAKGITQADTANWNNKQNAIVAGTGIGITGTTITNNAPDQTVSLTGSGSTTVTGTYPNFTVSSTDNNTTYTAGTGIGITGTTITNSAPDKVVSLTGSGSTTVTGTYPNFTVSSTDNNTTYTAGTGIGITGTTITNSAPDKVVSLTGSGSTTVTGTYPNFTVSSTDNNTTYTAGTGISITGNVISATSSSDKFYLGQDTLGGYVYYIYKDASGQQHGLIVSKTENTSVQWQSPASLVNANRTEDGAYNTGVMTNSPAKTWVQTLGAGWYLPSIDELSLLYQARYHINKVARAKGTTLLSTTAYYWSSTEYVATNAFYFDFFYGYSFNNSKTSSFYSVRGVRAF